MSYAILYILQKKIALDTDTLSWENNQHVVTPPLDLQNDIWGMSTEINSTSMKCHYLDLSSASDWLKIFFNQSKAPPRPGYSDTPSVWNFGSCSSGKISCGNKWWHYEMCMPFEKSLKKHMLEGTNDMSPDLKNDQM